LNLRTRRRGPTVDPPARRFAFAEAATADSRLPMKLISFTFKPVRINEMTYKKKSQLLLPVLALALTVPGLTFVVGNQTPSVPTHAANFTDDRSAQVLTAAETAGTYSIDPWHTNVGFRVRHMGLAIVPGKFTDYTATISYDPNDITKSSVQFTATVASLDTGVKQRDDHLRSSDFFETGKFPEMTFRSTRIERKSDKTLIAYGDLTIKNVTKQIALPVEFYGAIKDSQGQTRLGGSTQLNINRLDYGVKWSQTLDNGSLVVDNNVQIDLQFEALRQETKKDAAK
jgi:polyisoprenoid-binding protein YceI